MTQPTNTPVSPSVLGVQRQEFTRPVLISDTSLLWGVWCHPAQDPDPRVVVWYKSEAAAQRYLLYVIGSTWTCSCGQPYATHRALEAPTFALQREADQSDARDAAEAAAPPAPDAPAAPAVTGRETMADPEGPADSTSARQRRANQPTRSGRGPHADRLERARAVHEAAKKAMPKKPLRREIPQDPFEEDV